ncbi:endo mannanase- GH76 family [Apiospora saccharicola]|uniref:mannan endo-1,6-alpha-mannosidase n=1 Tax=Apiospora saccharicola TaxID=335842 RepID=A0ABR1UP25_9PEZI
MFFKSVHGAAILTGSFVAPKDLNTSDVSSIRSVASTLAYGTMSYYTGNITNTPETLAVFPAPVYWWESGACWGSMLDYQHYTGDTSYHDVITQAILSQVGPNYDFMVPRHFGDEGNDDQAFWSFTHSPWLTMAENIWNTMVERWNTTTCGGGIAWQIFASNPNGMSYKNSVSNGGLFQLSARLARATGKQTYQDWAQKIWDWSESVGFVDGNFNVMDGADSKDDCRRVSREMYSYSQGIYLYGAAVLYNHTRGDATWGDRTTRLLAAAGSRYFSPYANATGVMFEQMCEISNTCDTDMLSFKAYLSRFLWATTQMMPSTLPTVQALLVPSALAAGQACSGGANGTVCGHRWYVGGYDGTTSLGQQMSALEVVQGLLVQEATPPLRAGEIQHVKGMIPAPAPAPAPAPPTATLVISTVAAPTTSPISMPQGVAPAPNPSQPSSPDSHESASAPSSVMSSNGNTGVSTPGLFMMSGLVVGFLMWRLA